MNNSKKFFFFLVGLGIALKLFVLFLLPAPRSLDEIYYIAMAKKLFQEGSYQTPIVWHYFTGFGKEAFILWMPLNSLLLSIATFFSSYRFYQLIAFVLTSLASVFIFYTFKDLLEVKEEIFVTTLSAFLPLWFIGYFVSCDTFYLYFFLGAAFFRFAYLVEKSNKEINFLFLGIIIGLLQLARADGVYFLPVFFLGYFYKRKRSEINWKGIIFLLLSYLTIVFPWYYRNLKVFGKFFPINSQKIICMKEYNEIIAYGREVKKADWFTFIWERVKAFEYVFFYLNVIFGSVVLAPFFWVGLYRLSLSEKWKYFFLYFFFLVVVNIFLFAVPFRRSTFWHSSVALYPFFLLALYRGFKISFSFILRLLRRSLKEEGYFRVFSFLLFFLSVVWGISFIKMWMISYNRNLKVGEYLKRQKSVRRVATFIPDLIYWFSGKESYSMIIEPFRVFKKFQEKEKIDKVVLERANLGMILWKDKEFLEGLSPEKEIGNLVIFSLFERMK